MDEWAWEHPQPWIDARVELPGGPPFCVINRPTRGRAWSPAAARADLRRAAATAGVRRRFAPGQLRHAHAEMAHEGVPLIAILRQLGHSNLCVTSIYLQGIDNAEIGRRRPRPSRTDGAGQRLAPALTTAATPPLIAQSGRPLQPHSSPTHYIRLWSEKNPWLNLRGSQHEARSDRRGSPRLSAPRAQRGAARSRDQARRPAGRPPW